jgi:hypothetical protein
MGDIPGNSDLPNGTKDLKIQGLAGVAERQTQRT